MIKSILWASAASLGIAGGAIAEGWTLDGEASRLAFGSVKSHYIGEVSTFSGLSGTVDEDGSTSVDIPLVNVETMIDIRNERMIEHVFKMAPSATLSTQIDMDAMSLLAVGEGKVMEVELDLTLLGEAVPLWGDVFVMRVGEDQVMVTTDTMVYVATDELGIDPGIDKLQELASLEDITRAVPVTLRFMFTRDTEQKS